MNDIRERVREETLRFFDAIPELMSTLAGKWVVFRDGEVKSSHDTEDEAYVAGLQAFGAQGGHVIACVKPPHPTPISASIAFGVA